MFVVNFLLILLSYRPINATSTVATLILSQGLSSYSLRAVQYFSFYDKTPPSA
jgi:uncharacterized membrane-anchored protein YitT (DUF2179 family)